MRKTVEANELVKRKYVFHLEKADGLDSKSTDKVLAAMLKFEQSTGFKSFKRFHIDQAAKFKTYLSQAKNQRGKPLSHSTVGATLRIVSKFFLSLAGGAAGVQEGAQLQRCEVLQQQSQVGTYCPYRKRQGMPVT